jgi:hypothetical protein
MAMRMSVDKKQTIINSFLRNKNSLFVSLRINFLLTAANIKGELINNKLNNISFITLLSSTPNKKAAHIPTGNCEVNPIRLHFRLPFRGVMQPYLTSQLEARSLSKVKLLNQIV